MNSEDQFYTESAILICPQQANCILEKLASKAFCQIAIPAYPADTGVCVQLFSFIGQLFYSFGGTCV